jgi:hypothetical protein
MATSPKNGKLLYHFTALSNLEAILSYGLISRENVKTFDDVADNKIIEHRQSIGLNNYVPFHFFAGTPFDGSVQCSFPEKAFVYITIQRSFAEKNSFLVLKRHPLSMPECMPLSYLQGMKEIDWEIMKERNYNDHDCKEVCMAECISPQTIAPESFFNIYTKTEEVKAKVVSLRDRIVGSTSFFVDVNSSFFVK